MLPCAANGLPAKPRGHSDHESRLGALLSHALVAPAALGDRRLRGAADRGLQHLRVDAARAPRPQRHRDGTVGRAVRCRRWADRRVGRSRRYTQPPALSVAARNPGRPGTVGGSCGRISPRRLACGGRALATASVRCLVFGVDASRGRDGFDETLAATRSHARTPTSSSGCRNLRLGPWQTSFVISYGSGNGLLAWPLPRVCEPRTARSCRRPLRVLPRGGGAAFS